MIPKRRCAKGQIAVILALVLPAVVGAVALGADFAVMYFDWVQLQKAADTAALAGASFLPNDLGLAMVQARTYALQNAPSAGFSFSNDSSAVPQWVQVQLTQQVPYNFGRVLGLTSANISVLAKAGIQPIVGTTGQGGNVLPIGVQCASGLGNPGCPSAGTTITLNQGQTSGSWNIGPGDWGPLQLPGMTGNSSMLSTTENGWVSPDPTDPADSLVANPSGTPGCSLGPSCLNVQPGDAAAQGVANGMQWRLNNPTSGCASDAFNPASCNAVVVLPLVNYTGVSGESTSVPLLGFVAAQIIQVNSDGSVVVQLLNTPVSGAFTSGTASNANNTPYTVVLEQ
ncbi:MAG: hypothetical protein IVW54_17480 [Candidatus Binataceae bacterium]|nr:hypothetical protein [Candidatus Binataceae bacterium]